MRRQPVTMPRLRIGKAELLDRATTLAASAAHTSDPILKRARLEAAEALQIEAVKAFPSSPRIVRGVA